MLPEQFDQLLECGLRVLNRVVQQRGYQHVFILNAAFIRKYVRQSNGVIDIGRRVGVFPSLVSMFIGSEGRCLDYIVHIWSPKLRTDRAKVPDRAPTSAES